MTLLDPKNSFYVREHEISIHRPLKSVPGQSKFITDGGGSRATLEIMVNAIAVSWF
jgi:hypothetical protein